MKHSPGYFDEQDEQRSKPHKPNIEARSRSIAGKLGTMREVAEAEEKQRRDNRADCDRCVIFHVCQTMPLSGRRLTVLQAPSPR